MAEKKIRARLRARRVPEGGLAGDGLGGALCAKGLLVFVDEMGSDTSPHELFYAYSPRGARAYCSVARNRGKNTTPLSSMRASRGWVLRWWSRAEPTGRCSRAIYLRQMLVPALKEGDVVVMDDLSVHKSERVREVIEGAGAEILYLPPYSSPDFDPIEEAFSKIKNLLRRKAGARVREALVEAIGEALSEVTEEDARAFFEHCGYREAVQLL
jgi:transposase